MNDLLHEIAVFVKVVDLGSFSAASRQLGTTPSATSRAVSRLETALGTQLLERSTRKLRLSDSGQAVYRHGQSMVNAAQAALEVSGHINETPQGTIRISVPKAVGHYVIHPHIPDFLAQYPEVDVLMRLEDRHFDLIDDPIDLALRITDQPPPGSMGRELMKISHIICATPHYLATHGSPQDPKALQQHSCICLGEIPADAQWKFQRGQQRITVPVKGRYAANHTGVRLSAIQQHLGIGSLPYFTAREALEQGEIVQVLPEWTFKTQYCGGLWVLYPPNKHLPAKLRALIQFLSERLAPATLKNP